MFLIHGTSGFTGCRTLPTDAYRTHSGAMAIATFYSLIETAKTNGLEPYAYLRYIFEKLPLAQFEQDLKKLLPQNINPDTIAVNN